MWNQIVKKVFSGQGIWAIAAAVVFVWKSIDGALPIDDVKMILAMVVTYFFTKQSPQQEQP